MSEEQADYTADAEEAMEMLGKGYEAAYEIHMPARVLTDSEEGMREQQSGVWVKITASFREKHLKNLKGSRLGVWLCLALHINEKNDSHPSIETICKETGYSNREVIDCIRELETNGYLTVKRGEKRYNIYHVNFGAAYGKGNDPTSEESSQVKFRAGNGEVSSIKTTRQSSLKEEPIKKNQKERELLTLNFESMTIPQARKIPTLKMYSDATGWFPSDVLWEKVHNIITENRLTVEKIRGAAVAWFGQGYNRQNVMGILEWAVNGIPASIKGNVTPTPQPRERDDYGPLIEYLNSKESQQ
jgi:hypothetical protein